MPTAYLHVGGRIFTIFNKYLTFTFHQASPSKSDQGSHIARAGVCSSKNTNCPARPAEQHRPCREQGQLTVRAGLAARSAAEQGAGATLVFPTLPRPTTSLHTFVADSPWSSGPEETSFTAWGQPVWARASPLRAVTSMQTWRENQDKFMDNWQNNHG